VTTGFVLRAPWYVRERHQIDLNDAAALRPTLQKYGSSEFVAQLLADPRDSLQFLAEDRWSYPVPIILNKAHGRERFATYKLHTTKLRKLFQPTHDRYYAVVVEVFCDEPGWPRAGGHDELEVGFVMRRRQTTLKGDPKEIQRAARKLLVESSCASFNVRPSATFADSVDLYYAEQAWQEQFKEDNAGLLAAVQAEHQTQAWMINATGGVWRDLEADPLAGEPVRREEEFLMWRLPPEASGCEEASSRSLWFGVVPTFSAEHWIGPPVAKTPKKDKPVEYLRPVLAKLDDHEIYELLCFVRQPPPAGREDCPAKIWWSKPTRPFRLAAPFDPDGTKNHSVTITTPDLRRLAARAGEKLGPGGGARIVTPPRSGLPPPPFGDLGKSSGLSVGAGGTVCFFAFELFFLVALFLFLLFLPIIVFMFQLWWMLALKFCLPPSISFQALAEFVADGKDLPADADAAFNRDFDAFVQMPGAAAELVKVKPFKTAPTPFNELVAAVDPENSAEDPKPPPVLSKPDDPLCPPTS
jgi:hypothetical protein